MVVNIQRKIIVLIKVTRIVEQTKTVREENFHFMEKNFHRTVENSCLVYGLKKLFMQDNLH